jgi:hypothetical protein
MTTNVVEAAPARRRLILALGRGKSGKTIWARWLTEAIRGSGINPVVVDADTDDVGLCRDEEGVARMPFLRADLVADRHEIPSLIGFSKLGVAGREPLAFKRLAVRTRLERMETAFTPFGRELALG